MRPRLLVHISAQGSEVLLEPAQLDVPQAFWSANRPQLPDPPADLEITNFEPLAALSTADAAAFGTKAANLGELSGILPAENRVSGFAIPFSAYASFMEQRGLSAEVEALLADARVFTDAAYKRDRLAELRRRIRSAELPPALDAALEKAVLASYGEEGRVTRLRFRSSTNAEDLPGVSGAGLYDSRSGCPIDDIDTDTLGPSKCLNAEQEAYLRVELDRRRSELAADPARDFLLPIIADLEQDLSEEKSARLALRRVWASLWNERAFDDREYYGIDQRMVFMGVGGAFHVRRRAPGSGRGHASATLPGSGSGRHYGRPHRHQTSAPLHAVRELFHE